MANEKMIAKLAEQIEKSDKKETYQKYIYEVTEKCLLLCKAGEYARALTEYNYLLENLKKTVMLPRI